MILSALSAEHHSLQSCRSWFIHRLWSSPACPSGRGAEPGYSHALCKGCHGSMQKAACFWRYSPSAKLAWVRLQTLASQVELGAVLFSLESLKQ